MISQGWGRWEPCRATGAKDFPRLPNRSGRAGGHHASLRTGPDNLERWASPARHAGLPPPGATAYFRMFTARATTRIPTTTEIVSSAIIMSFAHGFIAETSVGLNAIEVLKDRCR